MPLASSVLGIAIVAITGMQLMSTLDGTIVIVALPRMQAELDLSDAGKSWVITAYVLAFGGLLLLGGRVGDAIGHKRAFLSGVGVFTIASLVCGLANDERDADRGARRAGHGRRGGRADRAGAHRDDLRGRAGPQSRAGDVGGDAGHRLRPGPGARRCAHRHLLAAGVSDQRADRHRDHHHRGPRLGETHHERLKLDITGALLATLGCTSAVFVFTQGPPRGWIDPWVIGAGVASAMFFIAFLIVERTADYPIVPFSVFDNRNRVMTFVSLFLAGGVMLTLTVMIGLLVQDVLGYSALKAGICFIPFAIAFGIGSAVAARLAPHVAPRWLIIGSGLFVVAAMLYGSTLDRYIPYFPDLFGPIVVGGFGIGAVAVILPLCAVAEVGPREIGPVSSITLMV